MTSSGRTPLRSHPLPRAHGCDHGWIILVTLGRRVNRHCPRRARGANAATVTAPMSSTFHDNRVVSVYEPTVTGLPPLRRYFASVWERRPFIWHLARTDMKSQHYDTVLGFVWLVADPLLLAATFYLIRA